MGIDKDYCPDHIQMAADIAVVKEKILTSIDDVKNHVASGSAWRMSIIGVVIAIVLQVIGFVYLFGQLQKQVIVNTERLTILESIHPRTGAEK